MLCCSEGLLAEAGPSCLHVVAGRTGLFEETRPVGLSNSVRPWTCPSEPWQARGAADQVVLFKKFNPRRFPRQAAADRSHLEGMIRQRNRARVQGSRTKGNWTATAERHFRATKGICTEDMVPGKSAEDLVLVWKVGSLLFLRLPVTLFLR